MSVFVYCIPPANPHTMLISSTRPAQSIHRIEPALYFLFHNPEHIYCILRVRSIRFMVTCFSSPYLPGTTTAVVRQFPGSI
jgi:hypothetical protein